MESHLHAYQAYESRAARGEFSTRSPRPIREQSPYRAAMEASLGDLMIRIGLRLKKHAFGGKSMVWSPATGSKP